MKYVTQKVAIVQTVRQILHQLRRQLFKPLRVVAPQGDIQRQNIFDLPVMHRLIAYRRPGGGKAM